MKKEDFINNVLNSADGMSRVIPDEALFSKIEAKINSKNGVTIKTIWLVAAAIVVLISLNIFLLKGSFTAKQSEMAILEHAVNKSNQLYK